MKPLAFKIALGASALAAAAWVAIACSDDPHLRTSPEQALGGGGACAAMPGQLPAPNCDNSDNNCTSHPGCVIDEARCGSKSTCLPIGDNKGKDVQSFRIRRLNIATPQALAGPLIQDTVVTLNVSLAEKTCGEQGKGLFTWLLQVDRKNNTLTTGGAPPPTDAIGQGFCFARFDLGTTKIAPITTKVAFEGDTFHSLEPQKLGIPIFVDQTLNSVIILPITDVKVEGVTISDEGQCIGHLNPLALDSNCMDNSLCAKWQTSGSLGGYITLEEADAVKIAILNGKSLCAFLSGEIDTCARDPGGKILYQGDFCSKDKTPGSCADSMWLAATFAASAAKIFDGQGTVAGCSGVVSGVDAGDEGGLDAGPDVDAADAADGD
ncbi:MAG: hypothetical protein JWO86_5135 [Myxococcaceae bacterium]|jgi:hypothetical protein|nr:hypothetical protein [Myxococcaceae bacterium]MEA2751945.1 hypothetical protein [Myxococcales bacterium]